MQLRRHRNERQGGHVSGANVDARHCSPHVEWQRCDMNELQERSELVRMQAGWKDEGGRGYRFGK